MTRKQFELEAKALRAQLKPQHSQSGNRHYYNDAEIEEIKRMGQIGRDLHLSDKEIQNLLGVSHGTLTAKLGRRTQPYTCHLGENTTYVKRAPITKDEPSPEVVDAATHATAIARAVLTVAAPAHEVEELALKLMRAGEPALRDVCQALSVTTELPTTRETTPEEESPSGQPITSEPRPQFEQLEPITKDTHLGETTHQVTYQARDTLTLKEFAGLHGIPSTITVGDIIAIADRLRPLVGV